MTIAKLFVYAICVLEFGAGVSYAVTGQRWRGVFWTLLSLVNLVSTRM